jgi:hypothetical protein
MHTPTKTELKLTYGIPNDDFEIRTTLPPMTTQSPGSWVEKRVSGTQTAFLQWRRKGVLAFIALCPCALAELSGSVDTVAVLLSDSDHEWQPYLETMPQRPVVAVTTPAPETTSRILSPLEWDALPNGSTLRMIVSHESSAPTQPD